jgi:ribosomal protein S18 acetylase RimI-like enzyme
MAYNVAMSIRVRLATPEDAELMHEVMQRSFAEYLGVLRVASSAHAETVADVRRALALGGGALAWIESACVGSARFALEPEVLCVGRVAVLPEFRRRGIASRLMRFIEEHAPSLGRDVVSLKARAALPSNVELYRSLGYEVLVDRPHPRGDDRELTLAKRLR